MRTNMTAGLLAVLLVTGCASLHTDLVRLDGLDTCPAWKLDELIVQASSFDHRTDTDTLLCALGKLRSDSDDQLRPAATGARVCYLLADRSTVDQDRCEKFAAEGLRWAEAALSGGADKEGAVHYYLAVNLGMAVREHLTLAVQNLKRIEKELLMAQKLAPQEDRGGPARVLGLLYLMAPPWPEGIGDGDKALELLHQAVEQFPRHPLNHIFYARALWELEEDDARTEVERHLLQGRDLIEQGDWGTARERWLVEMRQVANEAEIVLQDK